MNYSGKFDAKLSADGSGPHSNVHVETVHAAHAPADAIVVPDAHLLFNGDFKRSGVDLILSKSDQELVLHDYFKGEKRAALSSPDGAHLTGDLVNALTGHVEYAQADGSASVSHVIGHVSKLAGTATVIRNGVSVILNNGDNVEKGDVVQSGSNSTLGITFIDGTVFGLSSNARMVLNEMVYDPNGSNNSSLLSLVAGTITFVAGETAKHGDMKVDTPVATMGIRGTAVLVEIDFTVFSGAGLPDCKYQVLVEPDGTTGSYILFDKTTLTPLAVLDKAGLQINISNGILSQTANPLSPEVQKLITDVFSLKFTENTNPNTNVHFTDSIVPQSLAPIKLADGTTATPFILHVNDSPFNSSPSLGPNGAPIPFVHIDQPPQASASGKSLTAHTGTAKSTGVDTVSGLIRFTDINATDLPTVTTHFVSLKLQDAQHNDITATLTPQQLAAVEAQLVVTPSPGNNNNGSATWTYSVADGALDFLTAGETLTLNYDAVVNNNFLPFEQQADAPFAITINGPSVFEWIHPTGDLWSIGSNWSPGTVPTATDDAIIPAEHIPGGSGLYDVTILTPAAARTLTLNANNTTGGQVINHSTLTIGEALTIFNDGVLNNLESGTVNVGGQIELLNQSSILNSGLITLGQGGDFKDESSVTNSGTIEVKGGTLDIEVVVANSGGTLQVDNGATLKLNIAAIDGGTINDNGTIDVTADSSINGTATESEDGFTTVNAILNNGGVTVESGVTLTLDNVTADGTTFTDVATSSTIQVDYGDMLALDGVTINGGTINDNGTIDVIDDSSINGTETNVLLNNGLVTVESGVTLTLDNVTADGTIFIDTAAGAILQIDDDTTLTLKGGATVDGGIINDGTAGGTGRIDVTGDSTIDGNATLNNGGVTVESDVTLTLDNVTVNGTTFTDTAGGAVLQIDAGTTLTLKGGATIDGGTINDSTAFIDVKDAARIDSNAILNNGLVTIESGATLTLDNVTANGTTFTDIAASSTIQVDSGDMLKLNGATISGGTVADNGTIDISGPVTFENGVAVKGGAISIASGATLDIENPVTGTGATLDGVNVMNSGTIQVDGPVLGTTVINFMLDGGTTVTGGTLLIHVGFPIGSVEGTVEIGTGGATFDHLRVTNNNSLKIDDGNTLTLSQVTINGGTINDGTADGAGGTIDITGNSSINGTTIDSGDGTTTVDANLNNGGVTVESEVTLTLDNVTVSGTTFTDLDTSSTIRVDDRTTLTLSQVTINGGTINDGTADGAGGTIDVIGNSSINGTTTDNGDGTTTVNAILNNGAVTVEDGVTLTLDNVTVNGTTFTDITAGSTIQVDSGDTLAFNGATIDGGTLDISGVLDSTGTSFINGTTIVNASHIVVVSGTLTIDPTSITNTATIEVKGGSTLKLSDDIITNTDGITKGIIRVDADPTHPATLDLDKSTISGGIVVVAGVLDSTGDSFITGATITNTGLIDVTSGTLTIDATSTFINTGKLESNGGNLIIDTAFSGSLEIKGGAVLELGAGSPATYSQATVTFDPGATGTLKLDHSQTFGGTVTGLDDNAIDLVDISSVKDGKTVLPTITYDSIHDTLTIVSNVDHTQIAHIQLTGDYTGVTWAATTDGNGGTRITEVPGVIAGLDCNGNASEGSPIKASITDGGAAVIATYAWQVFDNGQWVPGSGVADLAGNYTPGEADEGHALRVSISYVDALMNSESAIVSAGTVKGAADIPLVSIPDAVTTAECVPAKLSGLSVSTADGGVDDNDTFSATLYVEHGTLKLASGPHATISGGDGHDALDAVVITGSLADVNAALAAVTYTAAREFEGTDTVHFTATSTEEAAAGGKVSAAATPTTATITVNGIADTPILHANASAGSTAEDTQTTLTGLSVQPGDGSSNDGADSFTATLYVENGKLALGSGTFHVTAGGGDGHDSSHALIITGTLADVNAALAAVNYTPAYGFEGGDTVHFMATSSEDVGISTSPAAATTATITINPVAEAANLAGTVATASGYGDSAIGLTIVATKIDSDDNLSIKISGVPADATLSYVDDHHHHSLSPVGGIYTLTAGQLNGLQFNADEVGGILHVVVTSSEGTVSTTSSADIAVSVNSGLTIATGDTYQGFGTIAGVDGALDHIVNNGTIESTSLLDIYGNISGTGQLDIANNATLELGGSVGSNQIVYFNVGGGSAGELKLDNPSAFKGEIAGIVGTADVLDFHGFAAATTTAVTGAHSFNGIYTTLTVTDTSASNPHSETFKVLGDLSGSTWHVSDDHSGGVNIVDPSGTSQNIGGVVAHDPGPLASSTIVASAPNQTLTGFAASETFVFNFAGTGHTTVTDFHPVTDTLQFASSIFSNAQAALNATFDDGHGNAVVAIDAHDTIDLSGILKAQLHASDFHVV